jgi:diguanylate cyclase (GGDEF)-like protein/PAS domain S-box-containing protein
MEQEMIYRGLVEHSKDCLYYFQTYPEIRFKYLSPAFREHLGRNEQDLYDDYRLIFNLVHPDDFEIFYKKTIGQVDYNKKQVARWLNSNGEYIWTEDYSTPIYDKSGRLIGIEGSHRDITERIRLEEELQYKSSHDTMTGLYNRDFFEKSFNRLDKEVDSKVGIIICDLNGLKSLNDNFGHKCGDLMIKQSARLLDKYSSENIIVSRIGGDEFSIILSGVDEVYVSNIVKGIDEDIINFNNSSESIKIKMAVGFSLSENSLGNMNRLFIIADKRMYQAKKLETTHLN